MAGQSRTLKLSILADVDQLKKSLATANGDVESSSSKMAGFGKIAGAAFLAAGVAAAGYAATLLIDGVKSAIADEAAQAKLATTLKNVTGATNAQVAATEAYILKTSLATGVTDDELRPSLARLVRSTQDVAEAQKLQALALDIAAGGTVSLEAASNALAKAHDGNFTALNKLGGGIDASIIKAKDFDAATASLAETFEGQASKQADTFAGKMDRLKVAFDEGKESVGAKLLPIIQQLVEFVVNQVVPALGKFADFFKPITKAVEDNKETFVDLIAFLQKYVVPVLVTGLGGALKIIAQIIAGLVTGFANLISGIGKVVKEVKAFIKLMTDNPVTRFFGGGDNSKGLRVGGSEDLGMDTGGGTAGGGFDTGMPGSTFNPGADPYTFTGAPLSSYSPAMQAAILRREQLKADTERLRAQREAAAAARLEATGGLSTADRINITVNGAIDAEGTARTIVNVLNDSYYRGTGGANALAL
jgi:hypothetical protein